MPPLLNPIIMIWSKKTNESNLHFTTRAEAFAYMLKWQLEEKRTDPMDAAEKANQFADIFAANMGIPAKVEPQPEGLDKYIQMADKVVCYCDEHPRVVEYLSGAATFLVGLLAGKKIEQSNDVPPAHQEKIDFDKLD